MKTFKEVKQLFEIEGKVYEMDRFNKQIEVGSIVYDSRKRDFVKMEDEEDCFDYGFVAPELFGIMKEFKI